MRSCDLNLHGTERLVVNLGLRFAELVEGSYFYKFFAIFADKHIAHGDVVLGVASDDLDFLDRQRLAQVHGEIMVLADGASTPEEAVAFTVESIFCMVRRIPWDVGVDVGVTNQSRLFL